MMKAAVQLGRVAIYARVSTEEQAERGYSIDAQLDTLRQYCKQIGKTVIAEYVDRGISGKEMTKRHELLKMLRDAEAGQFDLVLVWKINRLSRKMRDLLEIVDRLKKYNIAFRSYSENFETETPMGSFALQMMGAVGELERNTIVDNVKMGMKQRARTGRWNGGSILGYCSAETNEQGRRGKITRLEIVPDEAVVVRKIFTWYAGGRGFKSIANQLNREGFRTKKGNPFGANSIRDIVTNPIYVGNIRYNRFEGWSEKRRRGKNVEGVIVAEGRHEGIIDQVLWDRVQDLFQEKSKEQPKLYQGISLLTGLIRCPECNTPMVASRTVNYLKDGTKVVRRYYSCGKFRNQGASVCHANSVVAEHAEDAVVQRIEKLLKKPKVLEDIVAAVNRQKQSNVLPLQQELMAIQANLAQLAAKKAKIMELYELDAIDRLTLRNRLEELTVDADGMKARKSAIEWDLEEDNQGPVSFEYVQRLMKQLQWLLGNISPEQQKRLLHLVIKQITVTEDKTIGKIELHFNEKAQKGFFEGAPLAKEAGGASFTWRRGSKAGPVSLVI